MASPTRAGQLGVARARPARSPSGVTTSGRVSPSAPAAIEQPLPFGRLGRVPPVRHLVAGQELAHLGRARRPPVADDLRLGHRPVVGGVPCLELRVDDRVELLLRRIPRLEQVVVEVDDVDGVDGRAGVGVGGEQYPAGRRVEVHRLLEELEPAHLRHAVVGEDDCDRRRRAASSRAARRAPGRPTRRARCGGRRRSDGADRARPPAIHQDRRRPSGSPSAGVTAGCSPVKP